MQKARGAMSTWSQVSGGQINAAVLATRLHLAWSNKRSIPRDSATFDHRLEALLLVCSARIGGMMLVSRTYVLESRRLPLVLASSTSSRVRTLSTHVSPVCTPHQLCTSPQVFTTFLARAAGGARG